MRFFLKQTEMRCSLLGLRSSLCLILAGWMLLTSVGISLTGPLPITNPKCQCEIQAQRSQNCCCFPDVKQNGKSCCPQTKDQKSQPPEDDGQPQLSSYCGLPASNGILIDREPRLSDSEWNVSPRLTTLESLPLVNDVAISHELLVDLPPPEFATC